MIKYLKTKLKSIPAIKYCYNCYRGYKAEKDYDVIPNEKFKYEFFCMKSYGDRHKDKIIYFINHKGGAAGFFAIYRVVVQLLYVADRFGWVPYIRIYDSHYDDSTKDNMFEYFFEQPSQLSYDEVYQSFNVVESSDDHMQWLDMGTGVVEELVGGYEIDDNFISKLALLSKKYIHIKSDINIKIEKNIEDLLNNKKTVAIHFRGNAYKVGFHRHPVALEIQDYYRYIDKCLSIGYEQIFIATDEKEVVRKLQNKYPNIVRYYTDVYRSDNGIDIHDQKINRYQNGYLMAFEVMRDMLTLVACDALICGNSQVTIAARIYKKNSGKNYEFLEIIDKGIYIGQHVRTIEDYQQRKSK